VIFSCLLVEARSGDVLKAESVDLDLIVFKRHKVIH
jgi:hypothetical protein